MKSPLFSVFIIASFAVAIAHCFPGSPRLDDSSEEISRDELDTVLILPNHRNPFAFPRPLFPSVPNLPNFGDDNDDDSLEGFNPFGKNFNFNPFGDTTFDDFITGMQGVMNRLREQMAGVLSGIPGQGALGLGGKIPEGGNTTSTTKVIDGHLVTINETTYQSEGDDSNVVYRVHTVVVTPLNQTAVGSNNGTDTDNGGGEEIDTVNSTTVNSTTVASTDKPVKNDNKEETTTQDRSVETVEDMDGNSIPNNKNEVDSLNA